MSHLKFVTIKAMILLILIMTSCTPTGQDTIQLQSNASNDNVILLFDGNRGGTCINDEVHRTQANVNIGNILDSGSCNSEIVVFSDDDRPAINTSPGWNQFDNDVSLSLGSMYEIRINVWIVDSDAGARSNFRTNSQNQFNRSVQLYNDMNSGITFRIATNEITRNDQINLISSVVQSVSNSSSCTIGQITSNSTIFRDDAINVYYVSYTGSRGFACGEDFIAIAPTSDNETLAHELGHTLSLSHITAPARNLMITGGSNRNFITIGQDFRMLMNSDSALNALGFRSGETRNCGVNTVSTLCPAVAFDVNPR